MSFDDQVKPRLEVKKQGKLVKFLISKGIAKDAAQASKILLGIAVVCFVLMILVLMRSGSQGQPATYYDEELETEFSY